MIWVCESYFDYIEQNIDSWCTKIDFNNNINYLIIYCSGINLSIKVLQAGAWPLGSTQVIPFAVPQEFEKSIKMVNCQNSVSLIKQLNNFQLCFQF